MDGPIVRPLVRNPENVRSLVFYVGSRSFDPVAEKTYERLIDLALETDENNVEALQTLASVRLSQQRPDEARQCLERAWSGWKDPDLGACSDVRTDTSQQLRSFLLQRSLLL